MTLVITNTNHTEIDVRYAWLRRERKLDRGSPRLIALVRLREIERLFFHRYGGPLPDDDAGLDDLEIAAHHIAHLGGNAERHILAWASIWAPWLGHRDEITPVEYARRIAANPCRWKADTLAWRLRLTSVDRSRLGITTIGAMDCNAQMRATRRANKKRIAATARRRAEGAVPREQSAARIKPWHVLGMSRATWYRRGKPMPETHSYTADGSNSMASTNSSHPNVSPRGQAAFQGKKGSRSKSLGPPSNFERPVRAVEPHLAEQWLVERLGPSCETIGGPRFAFLRRELVAGRLYLSAILGPARGIQQASA
jgi:hypothetical protein